MKRIPLKMYDRAWVARSLAWFLDGSFPAPPNQSVLRKRIEDALAGAKTVSVSTVRRILKRMNLRESNAHKLFRSVQSWLELTCTCPHSGDTIHLTQGNGEYSCPDCAEDIVVRSGVARHATLLTCPLLGRPFWVDPVMEAQWGCPCCGHPVTVATATARHANTAAIHCPNTRRTVQADLTAPSQCPACQADINLDSGRVLHAPRGVPPSGDAIRLMPLVVESNECPTERAVGSPPRPGRRPGIRLAPPARRARRQAPVRFP